MKLLYLFKLNNYKHWFLLMFCLAYFLQSEPALSQTKTRKKKEPINLQTALSRLEDHYNARLVYIDEDIPVIKVDRVKLTGNFEADLNMLLKNSGLKATKISDKQFVINKNAIPAVVKRTEEHWVQGRVYSINDDIPLEGASIQTSNSEHTIYSDKNGAFRIKLIGNEIIKISYIGFKQRLLSPERDVITNIYLSPEQFHLNNVEIFSNTDFIDYVKKADVSLDLQKSQLNQTSRTNLPQALNFSFANINVGHYAIDNVASYLDPIRLNGQDADYIVVLIEGKKRHVFSGLNLNYTTGMGYSGVDLDAIPQNLIQKIEVLPANQNILYGAEAIGGTMNFKLDTLFRGFNFRQHTGITTQGDGLTTASSLRYATGLPWSKSAFLDLSVNYKNQQSTNRSNAYNGLVYRSASDTSNLNKSSFKSATAKITENKRLDDSIVGARNFNRNVARYGDGQSKNISLWYHTNTPVGRLWKLYNFGGISTRKIRTYGFYRFPNDYKSASPIYPDGYLPEDPASLDDAAITVGLSRKNWKGFNVDFSSTYGRNSFESSTENTVNPSMGISSPTSFKLGQTIYSQSVNDITLNNSFKWHDGIHLSAIAMGGQFINSRYQIKAGDEGSYLDANPAGTPTTQLKLSGTNGHLGFSPANAIDQQRNQLALYGQATVYLDKRTEAGAGFRYENATLFTPQAAASFDIKRSIGQHFSMHATYNQSSKLPSLQQLYFSQTQYQFFPRNGISDVYKVMQLNSFSALGRQLGILELKPERVHEFRFSTTFTKDRFSLWASYNRINIKDRLLVSGLIALKDDEYVQLLESSGIDAIQFFKNIQASNTQVLQVIGTYDLPLPSFYKKLIFQADIAYNKTVVKSNYNSSSSADLASDRTFIGIVEDGQPKLKIIGKVNYQSKSVNIYLRNTYFGPVWYRDSSAELDQYFGGKVITDVGASWSKTRSLIFTMAFNNLLNIYPDKVKENAALNTNRTFGNQIVYSRQTSQFGIYGTYVSLSIDYKW